MTQDEQREYLIQYLLKEEIPFGRQNIPTDKQGQENLLRSLMNVRPPRPISNDFLKIQDEYLTERNIEPVSYTHLLDKGYTLQVKSKSKFVLLCSNHKKVIVSRLW